MSICGTPVTPGRCFWRNETSFLVVDPWHIPTTACEWWSCVSAGVNIYMSEHVWRWRFHLSMKTPRGNSDVIRMPCRQCVRPWWKFVAYGEWTKDDRSDSASFDVSELWRKGTFPSWSWFHGMSNAAGSTECICFRNNWMIAWRPADLVADRDWKPWTVNRTLNWLALYVVEYVGWDAAAYDTGVSGSFWQICGAEVGGGWGRSSVAMATASEDAVSWAWGLSSDGVFDFFVAGLSGGKDDSLKWSSSVFWCCRLMPLSGDVSCVWSLVRILVGSLVGLLMSLRWEGHQVLEGWGKWENRFSLSFLFNLNSNATFLLRIVLPTYVVTPRDWFRKRLNESVKSCLSDYLLTSRRSICQYLTNEYTTVFEEKGRTLLRSKGILGNQTLHLDVIQDCRC